MRKRIMVIDDDKGILAAISAVLETVGYEVETAHKVNKESLKNLEFDSPDAIVLDVSLAGQDGRKITQILKKNKKTRDIPIVMISAHPDMEKSVKLHGANDFLPKPFGFDDIVSKINTWTN